MIFTENEICIINNTLRVNMTQKNVPEYRDGAELSAMKFALLAAINRLKSWADNMQKKIIQLEDINGDKLTVDDNMSEIRDLIPCLCQLIVSYSINQSDFETKKLAKNLLSRLKIRG